MNVDGSGVVRLTQDSADDCQPHFSPDGTKIAWSSTRGGTSHIFVMNADGSGVISLSSGTADDFDPFWSPDGTRVGFSSARNAGQTLWTAPLSISGADAAPAQLIPLNGNAHWGAWRTGTVAPSPSPTTAPLPPTFAGQIVFVSTRDGNEEIYRMNADGTNQTRLTFDAPSAAYPANLDEAPSLSADGTKIAWASWRGGAGPAIWVMNADGSSPYQVVTNGYEPVWTPNGNLVYVQNSGTQSAKIYRISPNGQNNTYLTDGFHPRLSADGATMLFARHPSSGDDQIWLSSSNGSNATQFSTGSNATLAPSGRTLARLVSLSALLETIDTDFGNERTLMPRPGNALWTGFSPDGSALCFDLNQGSDENITVLSAQGTFRTRLTWSIGTNSQPFWGPGVVPSPAPVAVVPSRSALLKKSSSAPIS